MDATAPRSAAPCFQIVLADISMSLDNVLAVAGAAREHLDVLAIGLLLSVALMGAAAGLIARLLDRFRWISYLGLAIVHLCRAVHDLERRAQRDAGVHLKWKFWPPGVISGRETPPASAPRCLTQRRRDGRESGVQIGADG